MQRTVLRDESERMHMTVLVMAQMTMLHAENETHPHIELEDVYA